MSKTVEYLKTRRSPKKYVESYKLSDQEKEVILEASRWAPSSVGLEPYRILFIENKEIREEMKEFCWNQPGTATSSAMQIWIGYKEEIMKNKIIPSQNERNVPEGFEKAREYRVLAYENVKSGFEIDNDQFCARQAYISLGCALVAAEEIGIDFCPIEGMLPRKIEKILEKHNLIDLENEFICVAAFMGKVDKESRNYHAFDKLRREKNEVYKIVE
ncbi:hypothetical protein SCHIN_v1c06050 [Spiroplasma chinense]|uniref:Nitroreductase domain-containing protein n=1 Tax=Spiroplasma chinense TaxID=216932 RepID=A0A5B9Y6V2_9MOLU|nr:nitroreductase family protein [Spiroplasma chinense]QEH61802.1 hypothetical protein SCHIN_v1c06050 [Spiroplasma chinense]